MQADFDAWFRRQREDAREAMLAAPVLAVRHHADLEPPLKDHFLVAATVTVRQEMVAVWSSRPAAAASGDVDGASNRPKIRNTGTTPSAASVVVTVHGPGARVVSRIDALRVAYPLVEVLLDQRVLIVGARTGRSGSGADRNAFVYDEQGEVVAEGTLGDGISHLQTTSAGEIWVGYFDEGIYGDHRGTEPSGRPPLGSSGLATFDSQLRHSWAFPSHVEQPWGAISDCVALNVTDQATWTCYYAEFPVVRISAGEITSWANQTSGSRALAAADNRIALAGGYEPHRDRLVIGHLDAGEVDNHATMRLVLPDGAPLPTHIHAYGRGTCLHFLDGTRWFRLDPLD